MEVLIHVHPEGRIVEGYRWINTDVRGIYLTYLMILFMRNLYRAILSSAKHWLISTVTPSSDQSRYNESYLMCAFLTGLSKVVANSSVTSARLFGILIFWRVHKELSIAFSLFFVYVLYCFMIFLFLFTSFSLKVNKYFPTTHFNSSLFQRRKRKDENRKKHAFEEYIIKETCLTAWSRSFNLLFHLRREA